MPPPPPPVPISQNLPLSPPPSIVSTPPASWDAMSVSPSSGQPTEPSSVTAAREWARRQQSHQHVPPPQSGGYTFGTGGGSAQAHQSGGKARLEDWEIVETLGTGTFGRVLLVRQRPNYRPTSYHPIFPHLFQSLDPLSPSPSSTQAADGQLPHFAMKVLK
jgi:protein kinase A